MFYLLRHYTLQICIKISNLLTLRHHVLIIAFFFQFFHFKSSCIENCIFVSFFFILSYCTLKLASYFKYFSFFFLLRRHYTSQNCVNFSKFILLSHYTWKIAFFFHFFHIKSSYFKNCILFTKFSICFSY